MRGYATFFLIAVMTLGLVFLLVTRSRKEYTAVPSIDPAYLEGASGDGGAGDGGVSDGGAMLATGDAAADAAAVPSKPAERPLRVTALGWELVAAGVALTAADGGAMGPAIELAPETALDAVEARLARGGGDPVGADVAVMPLPAFVAAYDRLRALEPRAFAVVGFSRGREEVHANAGALLKAPPAADEVKLVAFGPAADATAKASGSESATVLGLFALDLLGVPPTRIRIVAPGADAAKGAPFSAITRGAADDRKLAFSSADASRFIPIVAIAPKAQLDANEPKMRDFAKAWLDGLERSRKDASLVARRLANKEALPLGAGVGGAPEAIALLERLGQIEPITLAQQRVFIGASATGPVTLDALTQKTWSLARAGGLTTSAAPSPLPIDERIALAIAPAPAPKHAPEGDGAADAGAFAPLPTGTTPLLVYRAVDAQTDAAAVAAQIGFLAGVFEHAAFRVTAKGGDKAARAIAAQARDKFDVSASRLATAAGEPTGAFASVEIVSLP